MRRHLTYPNVVASLALFVALGGSSYAALKLPKNSVTTREVKNGSLLGKDFKPGQLRAGPAGATGPVVVVFTPPDETGSSSGCADADPSVVEMIRRDPSHFYVNVHNSEFRAGAVRGQLPKSPSTRRRPRASAAKHTSAVHR